MIDILNNLLDSINKEATVLFTAALPLIEVRGAIPVGVSLGMSLIHTFILSIVGSMIPVPIILFGTRPIFTRLRKTKLFRGLIEKLTTRSLRRSGKIQKYGFWGLLIFVAIPLHGTGVWSGDLAAEILDMRFKLAFPAILIGNIIAGIIMLILSHGVVTLL